jgi:UPF0755 protein
MTETATVKALEEPTIFEVFAAKILKKSSLFISTLYMVSYSYARLRKAKEKSMKKIIQILGMLVVVAIVATVGAWHWLTQPVMPEDTSPQSLVIVKGAATAQIGNQLFQAGLIRHPLVFRVVVRQLGLDQRLQAGSFKLNRGMDVATIARSLTEGTQDTWVTVLEGWRREEIADYFSQQELTSFDQAEFLELTKELEGRLYPDTYLVPREISIQALVELLTSTFESKVINGLESELSSYSSNSGRTLNEILVMASLVEREARSYEQMRHVAGILWNRIEIGMALQVDATLQYAKGGSEVGEDWWTPPAAADKLIDSPYNTYLNAGLPPTPIANPSLNAIKATVLPLEVDDLFYLHAADGSMYYAQTLEAHNQNVNRYLR